MLAAMDDLACNVNFGMIPLLWLTFDIPMDDPCIVDSSQPNCQFARHRNDVLFFKFVTCGSHLVFRVRIVP